LRLPVESFFSKMTDNEPRNLIYLDNAATSFPKPECVYAAVDAFIRTNAGSPSRGLGEGSIQTNELLSSTRRRLASFLGIRDESRLIFTYSATDGLSTVLFGWLKPGDHVLITPLEHNSVLRPLDWLADSIGVTFEVLPHDSVGRVDPSSIRRLAKPNTRLIALSMISNVIGTVQPYREVCARARELGIAVLLDGAQAAGHIALNLSEIGAAFFACSGHKSMLGLQGTGLLYIAEGYDVRPLRIGGTGYLSESMKHPTALPQYYEAGTINMPGVASLDAALDFIEQTGLGEIHAHVAALTARLLEGLKAIPNVTVYGLKDTTDGHGGVVSFNVGDESCAVVGEILAGTYRIANRVGVHCAPLAHKLIGALDRGGAVRLSIGALNTTDDIDYALDAIRSIAAAL
jgi:cysteine desulfurase family protein